MQMMTAQEVRQFIEGHSVFAFDPDTLNSVACVDYGKDGRCTIRFNSGDTDVGVCGFDANTYWTRYQSFRNGETHAFHLLRLGPSFAQAYFTDGTKAFLQCHDPELPVADPTGL